MDTFLIHHDGEEWRGLKPGPDGPVWLPSGEPLIPRRREPITQLPGVEAAQIPLTEDSVLQQVVYGSAYKPEDVVAVCFATARILENTRLTGVYLTTRGLEERTRPGELREPYSRLERAVAHRHLVVPLEDHLEGAWESMTADGMAKTFHDYGGPDDRARVLAVYCKDTTRDILQ